MILPNNQTTIHQEERNEVIVEQQLLHNLTVWNDDINTFDWVIETLMKVCNHTHEQAEQCSLIIHYTGKCVVSKGEWEKIKKQCEQILERGISASVA